MALITHWDYASKNLKRHVFVLVVMLGLGIGLLSTGIMDIDWMCMHWHGGLNTGETWTFIPGIWIVNWYWGYVFTIARLVFGSMLCTASVVLFLNLIFQKREYIVGQIEPRSL